LKKITNKIHKKTLIVVIVLIVLLLSASAAFAECTMLIAGKEATEDGSIIIARNEDYGGNWAKHYILNEAEEHEKGATIESENGFVWELPEKTLKYFSVQDWIPEWGRFHETAINTEQVGVTATTTAGQNEKAKEVDSRIKDGLGENIVTTIVAQRAKTAREGVKLVGKIIDEKGASETFGMAIADDNEAWLLEVGGGHHWVAVRVPDDSYFVGANALRIGEVDLEDRDNYLGSEDLIEFAVENGLYDPNSGEPFHFAKAYGTAKDYSSSNYRRVWGGIDLLSPSLKVEPEAKNYPLFVKPDKKISVADAGSLLRCHYQDSEYDSINVNQEERGIGTFSTIESHVMQLRNWLPNSIGGVQWISMSTPLASPYIPYYVGIQEVPEVYQIGENEYDNKSAYWAFRSLANISSQDYQGKGQQIREVWQEFEQEQYDLQENVEKAALEIYENDKELANKFLSNYSTGQALRALHKAYELRDELRTAVSRGR